VDKTATSQEKITPQKKGEIINQDVIDFKSSGFSRYRPIIMLIMAIIIPIVVSFIAIIECLFNVENIFPFGRFFILHLRFTLHSIFEFLLFYAYIVF
jgi:hypothetical protein